ncbi:VOC family protein [Actinoplanes sp. NEAU-A12]|uniref:VOC family protein n=1 Tax=Actinoplanes sandaracinus TaxID=3045177 RepID=A0ABT6WW84_9ACTN|nr:VOC family protein [Actinoplanes sandaracinus]MDI6103996.1 VOC family protein [Actinoplanes sandaracinus]
MVMARFKDLCLDSDEPSTLARFWAAALSLEPASRHDDGVVRLPLGPRGSATTLGINPVREFRTGKTRVHLDLRLADPEPSALIGAGASVLSTPGENGWWVLADPDGNAFCAFPPNGSRPGVEKLIVDSRDPEAQARWWSGITGGDIDHSQGGSALVGAEGFPWRYWLFDPVPEPKTVKNRLHWDVDLLSADPAPLIAAGATVLREPSGDVGWWVLADPEGNEFCAYPRSA